MADRKAESAEHIIEFPGGAIEVARLEDGSYWAHIIVTHGDVINSRVDWAERRLEAIPGLPEEASLTQVAVLIRPQGKVYTTAVQTKAAPAVGERLSFAPDLSTTGPAQLEEVG